MARHKTGRKPKGRLALLIKMRKFVNAKGAVAVPPLDYMIQVVAALDSLPIETKMLPEVRYRGYDNWRMG